MGIYTGVGVPGVRFRGVTQRIGRSGVRMGGLVKQHRDLLRQLGRKMVEVSGTRWGGRFGESR